MKQKRPNKLDRLYFIPQQDLIVGACGSEPNGSIRFWSIDAGKLKEVLDLGKGIWADSLAVSNNGNLIVTSLLGKNELASYSLAERKWLWKADRVGKGVVGNAMQFSADDRKVVVVAARNIITYNAQTGTILEIQEDSKGFSNGFPNYRTRIHVISPSARYAAFLQGNLLAHDETWWSSRNIWVLVRDIETGKVTAKQGKVQEKYKNCSAAFTSDEKSLLLGSMDGYVRVWSIGEQRVSREWRAYRPEEPVPFQKDSNPSGIESMILSPHGRQLATMGHLKGGYAIRIWDYSSSKLIHEFRDVISSSFPMCSGYPMAFSPDGKYFALEQQGRLCLYDTQTWQEKWCVPSIKGQE